MDKNDIVRLALASAECINSERSLISCGEPDCYQAFGFIMNRVIEQVHTYQADLIYELAETIKLYEELPSRPNKAEDGSIVLDQMKYTRLIGLRKCGVDGEWTIYYRIRDKEWYGPLTNIYSSIYAITVQPEVEFGNDYYAVELYEVDLQKFYERTEKEVTV